MTPRIRQLIEVLPPALLAVGALLLAWQMLRDELDERLLAAIALLAAAELVASFLDGVLAEWLEHKLAGRVIGFVVTNLVVVGTVAAMASSWGASGASTAVFVVLLLVPRFYTFVLDPPRDELDRLRVRALANDRLESVFVMLNLTPLVSVLALAGVLAGQDGTFRPTYALPGLMLAFWFGLQAAAAWRVHSPAFARRPERLLIRRPWHWLAYCFSNDMQKEHVRRERERELAAVRKYVATRSG
ncbi:MAG TPA: hypothetical protein VND91_11730 [Candidatus Saccharimonadia bacterium]|nr:hypothetical protein [Candidatus Saccharimonadia bacterium]